MQNLLAIQILMYVWFILRVFRIPNDQLVVIKKRLAIIQFMSTRTLLFFSHFHKFTTNKMRNCLMYAYNAQFNPNIKVI